MNVYGMLDTQWQPPETGYLLYHRGVDRWNNRTTAANSNVRKWIVAAGGKEDLVEKMQSYRFTFTYVQTIVRHGIRKHIRSQ